MALYAFDGTLNKDEVLDENDSNVVRFKDAYDGNVFYCEGIGTSGGGIGKVLGGITGFGGKMRINEAFQALQSHFALGDFNIDIIGFSRGGAMALHFANMIKKKYPKAPIRFVGVWDAVASFGIPGNMINLFWYFTAADTVAHYYHAMSLDERRRNFPVTRIKKRKDNKFLPCVLHDTIKPRNHKRIEEVWFRGVHSDIGGGIGIATGLSYISLCWMLSRAIINGLPINEDKYKEYQDKRNPDEAISKNFSIIPNGYRHIRDNDLIHESVKPRIKHNNPDEEYNISKD